MTTLTANVPLLPEYCPHKLPTSCLLTGLPTCCACQDRRPHSSSYSKYIDGVGFVLLGTRQERYCWMCKEFWNARIAGARIRQSDAHIPDVPDQSGFLEQWYNWHRGYRIIKHDDGREERQALLGEQLEDTSPGYLPRTLNELRAGISHESAAQHFEESHASANPVTSNTSLTANSTEPDTIEIDPEDRIFDLPSPAPDTQPTSIAAHPTSRYHPEPQVATVDREYEATYRAGRIEYRTRRIASLRRELQRLRVSIDRVASGLRELGDQVPDSGEARNRSLELDTRLQTLEQRLSSTRGGPIRDLDPAAMDSAQRQEYLRQLWTSREITRDPATEIASYDRQTALLLSRNSTTQQTPNTLDARLGRVGDAAGHTGRPTGQTTGGFTSGYVSRASRRPTFGRLPGNVTANEANSAPIPIPPYGSRGRIDTPEGMMVLQPSTDAPDSVATEPVHINRVHVHSVYLSDQVRAAQLERDRIKHEYDIASEQLRSLRELQAQYVVSMRQREEAAQAAQIHEQNIRLFGTAEDVERQGADYESPISGLFNPYYSRIRAREDARRRGETPQAEQHGSESEIGRLNAQGRTSVDPPATIYASAERDFNIRPYGAPGGAAAMREQRRRNDAESPGIIPPDNIIVHNAYGGINYSRRYNSDGTDFAIEWIHQRRALGDDDFYGHSSDEGFNTRQGPEGTRKGLDKDDGRPEPLKDEDLSVKLECKICFSQLASVMVLPCGHCVMCKWCADQTVPSHATDKNRPAHSVTCPVCRKKIKQRATLYFC